jgi:hypothetical protein
MPHSFDVSIDSPVSVDEVFSAFSDEDYWQARLAAFDTGSATLDSLIVNADDSVAVGLRVGLFRDRLPKVITKLQRGDLEIMHNQTWSRIDGTRVRGEVRITARGAPLFGLGEALLAPVQSGSRLEFAATVEVNVPLVGGTIASFIGGRIGDEITEIQRFTNEWIAKNR